MTTAADTAPAPHLPDTLRLGPAHVTVSTLDGSIAFYERSLGLHLHDRDGDVATMGVGGQDLLVLVEEAGAAPGGRHAGLYHFALLFPTRQELARAVKRLATAYTRIEGALTMASPRRSTCATPTTTGSSSTSTVPASSGRRRARRASASRCSRSRWT